MNEDALNRDQLLSNLDQTVGQAVAFFTNVEGGLFDGHQTARAVLSHLVFWHRAYCTVAQDLLQGTDLNLIKGSLAELNDQAACEFQAVPMPELAAWLGDLQNRLVNILRRLPDWQVNFPFKSGCRQTDVAGRITAINDHIHHHLARQERAYERGEAWVKAYYP
jgi:hypothetical protein